MLHHYSTLIYFKLNLFICFSSPIILIIPAYFAVKVMKSLDADNATAYWTLTDFGKTPFFKLYAVLLLLLENVLPLILLIVMNLINHFKFKSIMKRKVQVISDADVRADKANNRFTKLIITLTFICIVTRSFDTLFAVYNRVRLFFGIVLSDELEALLNLLRACSFFLLFGGHACDGILYFFFDKNLKSLFTRKAEDTISSIPERNRTRGDSKRIT